MPVWKEGELAARLQPLADHAEVQEIIVVDGDPDGSSIRNLALEGVTTLISPVRGRGHQLRAGAEAARGEILLFLHADTLLPERALLSIRRLLANRPELAGGAFDLAIDSPRPIFRLIEHVSSLRSRLTRLPYGDQALFLRRSAYEAVGGFPALPLMEDVEICRRLKQKGLRIQILKSRVLTSPRRWEKEGLVRCTLRNWTLLSLYLLGVEPDALVRWYS